MRVKNKSEQIYEPVLITKLSEKIRVLDYFLIQACTPGGSKLVNLTSIQLALTSVNNPDLCIGT